MSDFLSVDKDLYFKIRLFCLNTNHYIKASDDSEIVSRFFPKREIILKSELLENGEWSYNADPSILEEYKLFDSDGVKINIDSDGSACFG